MFISRPNLHQMKICDTCKGSKSDDEFYVHKYSTKSGVRTYLSSRCKSCYKLAVVSDKRKKWTTKYKAYQAKMTKKNKDERRADMRKWLNSLKSSPCTRCGNRFPPECMDFDHRDPATKNNSITQMVGNVMAQKTIEKELEKCDLLCSNCHRIKTARDLNWHWSA